MCRTAEGEALPIATANASANTNANDPARRVPPAAHPHPDSPPDVEMPASTARLASISGSTPPSTIGSAGSTGSVVTNRNITRPADS
jgi:hypothetical protein